jgi:cation diffusion facilitator CzcD-associated flavoprotein CzcO
MPSNTPRNPRVVIIGAGMTGILMTIKLREAGITDIRILEKTSQLGGTWRENTYPGVACDIPSHMYTYSFEPNPDWSKEFADGAEIQQYFERVASKYGVSNSIQFDEAVVSSIYDSGKWTVTTSKHNTYVADFVVNCTGILHHPATPDIEGIDNFKGAIFHTARWDHGVDLKGRRVGIIGTGSTAAQVIPEVAKVASTMSVFQRTPQWLLPIPNRTLSERTKKRLRTNPNRIRRRVARYEWMLQHLLTKAVTGHKLQNAVFSAICKLYLRFGVKDPVLRAKLTPDYRVGCKRIVINTTLYPALQRSNVELVDCGIAAITPTGIRTRDGVEHGLDVIVLATGFQPTAYMRPLDMRGKNGLSIDHAWQHKVQTYRSVFMPGFPNNFLMLGPNTPIGNYSVIAMSEVQCHYILQAMKRWQRREFDEIDVKPSAVAWFADYMKAGMGNTVWVGGCNSWYLDPDGEPILWPYTWKQWESELQDLNMADFITAKFDHQDIEEKAA